MLFIQAERFPGGRHGLRWRHWTWSRQGPVCRKHGYTSSGAGYGGYGEMEVSVPGGNTYGSLTEAYRFGKRRGGAENIGGGLAVDLCILL